MNQKDSFSLWQLPPKNKTSYITGLKVANSLYPKELVEFIPVNGN